MPIVFLNKVDSLGFIKSSSTHKINCGNTFCQKLVRSFCTAQAPHIFSAKDTSKFVYHMLEILTSRLLRMSLVLNNWTQEYISLKL